jgi:hypothetical protein
MHPPSPCWRCLSPAGNTATELCKDSGVGVTLLILPCRAQLNCQPSTDWIVSELWVILRPMVSRPVCLGVKHPSGAYDQMFIAVRQLRVCSCRTAQILFFMTALQGPHWKQPVSISKSIIACVFVSAGTCLPNRFSKTAVCLFAYCIATAVVSFLFRSFYLATGL